MPYRAASPVFEPVDAADVYAEPAASLDRSIAVFAHDPDLLDGLPAAAAEALTARVRTRALTMPAGEWATLPPTHLGYLVVEGLAIRSTRLGHRPSLEVIGTGDLVEPWVEEPEATVPPAVCYRAETATVLAALDADFERVALRCGSVAGALIERVMLRARRLAAQNALSSVTPIERRVLLALWQLADRWGRVTPRGTLIPFQLSHRLIAEVVGATRPTVSSAVADLRRADLVERVEAGWLVRQPAAADAHTNGAPVVEPSQRATERRLALREWAAQARERAVRVG